MEFERIDRELGRWRIALRYSAGLFLLCFLATIYVAGGQKFVRIVKASFETAVCCIDRTRNPLLPSPH
jgi:hypothetical protein